MKSEPLIAEDSDECGGEHFVSYASEVYAAPGSAFGSFLPDSIENPKPRKTIVPRRSDSPEPNPPPEELVEEETEVTFFHDFVAGGVAGSASVIVGHPFDTLKVRLQASTGNQSIRTILNEFGGFISLFRGMTSPLLAASIVNALVFSSYGFSSRMYDTYLGTNEDEDLFSGDEDSEEAPGHDPWQKSLICGSFAGAVQAIVICPTEHIKCRMQLQHSAGAADYKYAGAFDACQRIAKEHGFMRLFQGWWVTCWREIPAFGLYFASYDYLKDGLHTIMKQRYVSKEKSVNPQLIPQPFDPTAGQKFFASSLAGGVAGSLTWGIVYPFDVIKTKIQTAPLDATGPAVNIWKVGAELVAKHGFGHLFRGLPITLIRGFPVNGTIFPVYEFTLAKVLEFENRRH